MNTSKVARFWRTDHKRKLLFAEVFVMLALAKMLIRLFKFKTIMRYLGEHNHDVRIRLTDAEKKKALSVKQGIVIGGNNVPWKSVCLDQALATVLMLSSRHVPHKICLGVKKNEQERKMDAHAWVECGGEILVGGRHSLQYNLVAAFAKQF